ncbi:MAG: bifunctional 3-(3-hydroxy-phenyl)propionate/3-hydroxycinnamic acid hydroxylase [Burkholderiales bacterium]
MQSQYDVAVVGFGPAGATCAALLGKLGLRALAIDRARAVYDKPRAFALDHEIMRVFQGLGVSEKIQPHTAPFAPSEYYGVSGQLIKRLGSVPPPYPLGWPPNLVFTQPPAEAALRVCAAAHASVDIALGTELVALEQSADNVTLTLREDSGAAHTVRARYAIGCDGASSTVRALSGLRYDDLGFDEPWLVVDVHVNEVSANALPQVCIQYCDPARPATYLIGPGNHRRWEIMLLPGENLADMAHDDNVWRLLARWIMPRDATLWRAATYRFHALVAREWRQGRVFIAGDAAHQQPPFTGQGMCQGIRDVANLTWKIALALRGKAADDLLDTYAAERAAHVRAYTTLIKDIGHLICERDPAAARARDQRLLAEAGGTIQTMPRQQLLPPLSAGLIAPDAHPANGTIFPQPRVFDGNTTTLLDDVSGTWFRIVAGHRFPFADMRRHDLVAQLDVSLVCVGAAPNTDSAADILHVTECDGVLARWFEQHQCAAAIVRPDHYVYGVATNAQDLDRQLAALNARLFKETP